MGYAIKTSLIGKLACSPPSERGEWPPHDHETFTSSWEGNKFATIISAYALSIANTDEIENKFYEDFEYVISAVSTADKLILLGDFHARVGQDSASWEGVLGKHGTGKCNSNGLLLLQTYTKHNLLMTNTVFHFPIHNIHPRFKNWHLIDYVIVRRRDRRDVSHQGRMWCRMLDRSSPNHF